MKLTNWARKLWSIVSSFLWFSSSIGITSVITISLWETLRIIIEVRVCRKSETLLRDTSLSCFNFSSNSIKFLSVKFKGKHELYYFLDSRTLFCGRSIYVRWNVRCDRNNSMNGKSWCNLRFNLEWFLSGFVEYTFQFSCSPLWYYVCADKWKAVERLDHKA